MALTPEQQQLADNLAKAKKEYDEDQAMVNAVQKALDDAKKFQEEEEKKGEK